MFFLLRMTFWLGVVCVLLPSGGSNTPSAKIDTASAVSAAGAAVSDMRGFCGRQPEACVVGGQVAVAIGHKAEAGARTIYELISAKLTEKNASGPQSSVSVSERGTLTPADVAPVYRAPVPLPPRREARAGRPSV
jgi:hypothetical protein